MASTGLLIETKKIDCPWCGKKVMLGRDKDGHAALCEAKSYAVNGWAGVLGSGMSTSHYHHKCKTKEDA